jgi:hypothetical protein
MRPLPGTWRAPASVRMAPLLRARRLAEVYEQAKNLSKRLVFGWLLTCLESSKRSSAGLTAWTTLGRHEMET